VQIHTYIHTYIHTRICAKKINKVKATFAFTLAEILIVLGVIGIISTLTIPTLLNNIQDMQYKSAYKKAYSNLYQAFNQAKTDNSLVDTGIDPVTFKNDGGNNQNTQTIIENFKLVKKCINTNNNLCWDSSGEKSGISYSADGRPTLYHNAFLDTAGMAWTALEWELGRIAVDTNGFKKPNQYGKDRFVFYLYSGSEPFTFTSQATGIPTTIRPSPDNYYEVCKDNACGAAGCSGTTCSPKNSKDAYLGTSWLYN